MEIPYEKTRLISTSELPGVISNPTLQFEFLAHPTVQFTYDVAEWSKSEIKDRAGTVHLVAQLIKAVIVPDGPSYELGTDDKINEFIEQTEFDFICNILQGWSMLVALERIADVKKFKPSLAALIASDGDLDPVSE